jgi:hypothetical protein
MANIPPPFVPQRPTEAQDAKDLHDLQTLDLLRKMKGKIEYVISERTAMISMTNLLMVARELLAVNKAEGDKIFWKVDAIMKELPGDPKNISMNNLNFQLGNLDGWIDKLIDHVNENYKGK